MSNTADNSDCDQEPRIRLGGSWLPAHAVREKMATTVEVVDTIEHFNAEFAHLATAITRNVVPCVRQRLQDIERRMPTNDGQGALAKHAAHLLTMLSPEDVIAHLASHQGVRINQVSLIQLAGSEPYREALLRDALQLELKSVSTEQTAQLWNDLGRPAPDDRAWRASDIEDLTASSAYEAI